MIRHTLLLRFGAGATPPERDAALQSLIALCDRVGEVTSLAYGPDVDPWTRDGFTHAFVVVFGSEEARDAFQALVGYAAAVERLSQVAEAVRVVNN